MRIPATGHICTVYAGAEDAELITICWTTVMGITLEKQQANDWRQQGAPAILFEAIIQPFGGLMASSIAIASLRFVTTPGFQHCTTLWPISANIFPAPK